MDISRKDVFSEIIRMGSSYITQLQEMEKNAVQINKSLLMDILGKNAQTEFGIANGFKDIRTPEQFRERLRVRTYADYKPSIIRMMENGEKNLLTACEPEYYLVTSGTTGTSKYLPCTKENNDLIVSYAEFYRFALIAQKLGDIWSDGGSPFRVTVVVSEKDAHNNYICSITCIGACEKVEISPAIRDMLNLSPDEALYSGNVDSWYINARDMLTCPDISDIITPYVSIQLEFMRYIEENWELLVRDIEHGTVDTSINLPEDVRLRLSNKYQPDSKRAAFLRREFHKGFSEPIMPRIWPKFSCVSAAYGGVFARYLDQYRRYMGNNADIFCYGYTASEGIFSVPFEMNSTESVLLPQSAFYEFVPEDQEDLERTLFMEDLKVGERYRVIVTTRSGMYRYDMGDIIEVKGFIGSCPRIEFLYKAGMVLSILSEHVSGGEVEDIMTDTFRDYGVELVDYSAFTEIPESGKGRYVFMAELKDDLLPSDDVVAEKIWQTLKQKNSMIKLRAERGYFAPPVFHRLRHGAYAAYREMIHRTQKNSNQMKPPHILKDKERIVFFKDWIEK